MNIDPYALIEHIQYLLSVFTDVWCIMCKPFIPAVVGYPGSMHPHNDTVFSYLTPVIVIGLAFCCIAFVKKLVIILSGGGSSW